MSTGGNSDSFGAPTPQVIWQRVLRTCCSRIKLPNQILSVRQIFSGLVHREHGDRPVRPSAPGGLGSGQEDQMHLVKKTHNFGSLFVPAKPLFYFFVRSNILLLISSLNILKEVTSRPLIIGKSQSIEGTTKCTGVRCERCSLIFSGESSAKSGRECFNRSAETFSRLVSREWWSAKIARMIGAASVRISPVLAISRSLCIKQAVSPSHLLNLYWDVLLRFPLANLVWNHWQKLHCIGC